MRSAVGLHKRFPSGIIAMVKVDSAGQIGQLVRRRRKEAGMTLKDAAALAGVGVRFLSELERGKPTLQLGLAISVLQLFGLELHVEQRGDQRG
jgi:HTH-type transcriptional regulator/antitoxin HipB